MKIGLIAMSGIRVCDEELLRLGLTLPGFVERSRTIASLPSLGLLTLAALTPDGHEVVYREIDRAPPTADKLEPFDLVAISTFSAQAREAYDLARRYREAGVPVVMGGLHVTACPEEAGRFCDAVVLGEGEVFWRDVVRDAARGSLKPLYTARDVEFDMAESPLPAFELLEIDTYNRLTVQTSRGCPHRCSFCASSVLLTPRYKQKPVGKVLGEIDRIVDLWPKPFLEFADDNGIVDRRYWKELLPELARRNLRWFTETDLSVGEDDALLDLMREAGCVEVLIGLESPVAAGLAGIELKTDWKRRVHPGIRDAVHRIQSHGIRVNGCFIIGLDGHDASIFDAVYRAVQEMKLYDVQITIQTPFPGTPLYDRLEREGRLIEREAWEKCTLFDLVYEPTPMTASQLVDGFHDLAVRLYEEEFTRWRRETFRKEYLRGDASRTQGRGA